MLNIERKNGWGGRIVYCQEHRDVVTPRLTCQGFVETWTDEICNECKRIADEYNRQARAAQTKG